MEVRRRRRGRGRGLDRGTSAGIVAPQGRLRGYVALEERQGGGDDSSNRRPAQIAAGVYRLGEGARSRGRRSAATIVALQGWLRGYVTLDRDRKVDLVS